MVESVNVPYIQDVNEDNPITIEDVRSVIEQIKQRMFSDSYALRALQDKMDDDKLKLAKYEERLNILILLKDLKVIT